MKEKSNPYLHMINEQIAPFARLGCEEQMEFEC